MAASPFPHLVSKCVVDSSAGDRFMGCGSSAGLLIPRAGECAHCAALESQSHHIAPPSPPK